LICCGAEELHDGDIPVRFEFGTNLWVLVPHHDHGPNEVANLRKRSVLPEHIHAVRARAKLENDIAVSILQHDSVISAHLGAENFDRTKLTGGSSSVAIVQDFFHTIEVDLVLEHDAHLIEHAVHRDQIVVLFESTLNHCVAVDSQILVDIGVLVQFLESAFRLAVNGELNSAFDELAES